MYDVIHIYVKEIYIMHVENARGKFDIQSKIHESYQKQNHLIFI